MPAEIRKILIAVDPLNEHQAHFKKIGSVLKWFKKKDFSFQFASVVNFVDFKTALDFDDKHAMAEIKDQLEKNLRQYTDLFEDSTDFVKILTQIGPSKSLAVQKLLNYAQENEFNLVIAHSHTKSIFKDSLGSFCHHLVFQSQIPLLVLPSEQEIGPEIHRILFPTDFSALSKEVFRSVLNFAFLLNLKTIVYHRQSQLADEVLQSLFHPIQSRAVSPSDITILSEDDMNAKVQDWKHLAEGQKCAIEMEINSTHLVLAESILSQSKKSDAQMIALSTHTRTSNVLTIGHTALFLLRKSPLPVLIIPAPHIT